MGVILGYALLMDMRVAVLRAVMAVGVLVLHMSVVVPVVGMRMSGAVVAMLVRMNLGVRVCARHWCVPSFLTVSVAGRSGIDRTCESRR